MGGSLDPPHALAVSMSLFSRRRSSSADSVANVPRDLQTQGAPAAAEALPAPDMRAITDESFMADTEGGWTIVDFWADWCGPCHQFAPTFAQAARLHGDRIRFAKLDVESARQAAALVGVQSIPTVVVFGPDGSEVTRASGVLRPADLERLIGRVDGLAGR